MTTLKFSKFISRYESEPIYSVDGVHKLHYVIDIYHNGKYFFPKVSRRDYFCIYPTGTDALCEEELLVFDVLEEWEKLKGNCEEEVLKRVALKIEKNQST